MDYAQLSHAVALSHYEERVERDPLSWFSFTNHENGKTHAVQVEFVRNAIQTIETYMRASNQNGKTHIGGALTLALVRGDDYLDFIKLPKVQQPCTWWVLCQSWKGMVDGPGAKLRELLGKWPHHISWVNAGQGYIGVIYVKYRGCKSDEWEDWSRIVFHVEGAGVENKGLPGGRIDGAWADEPPDMKRWREVRARGKANKPFFRYITATPLDRERWEELKLDFIECIGYVKDGKIELVADLFENPFLNEEHLSAILTSWRNDPFYLARAKGDYVDLTGVSPFKNQFATLLEMEKLCKPPQFQSITIRARYETRQGRVLDDKVVRFEWWHEPEPGESCYASVDTSWGIRDEDGIHDPGCIHVYGRKWVQWGDELYVCRRLLARFNDYESSYNIGAIAAAMCRQYNNAVVDVETSGGYGDAALDALADAGYTYYAQDTHREKLSKTDVGRLGFSTNISTKPMYVGQIQNMLEEGGSVEILSSAVISCFTSAKLDEYGRLYKPKGVKYEDLICTGRFLLWDSMNMLARPLAEPPRRFPEALNEAFGRRILTSVTDRKPLDRWSR